MILPKGKLEDVSFLRAFAIIAVVLYHSFAPYMAWNYVKSPIDSVYDSIFTNWFGARMPLFIFISGYLFSYLMNERGKYINIGEFIKKKGIRLIVPYIVFSLVIIWTNNTAYYNDLSYLCERILTGYSHLWFILMLFWCFLLARLLRLMKNPILQIVVFLIAFVVSICVRTNPDFVKEYSLDYCCFDRLLTYFVWFWLGYILLLHKNILQWMLKLQSIVILSLVWIICCTYIEIFCPQGDNYKLGFLVTPFFEMIKMISYFFFVLFAYSLVNILLMRRFILPKKWIENLNQCSYGIYIFHHWILMYLFSYRNPFREDIKAIASDHYILFPLASFFIVFLLSVYLTKEFKRTKLGDFLIG
jgi:peptidoglycan/LPS O-acetylase OafA/YrhL